MISAAARHHRNKKLPHPTVIAAFLFILVFCIIIRARKFCSSSSSEAKAWRDGSFLSISSFRDILHEGIKSMHVQTKSRYPSNTHTGSISKEAIIENTGEDVTIKTRLLNQPKGVRSIKDVQVSVVDGGSAITIQIRALHNTAGRQKMSQGSTTARPHWMYDHQIPLGEGMKIGRSGVKTTLGKNGELTIVARKLQKGESSSNNAKLKDL